jgi:hypothetical protein
LIETVGKLREFLRYEPETGKLFWLERQNSDKWWNSFCAGKEAFRSTDKHGYRSGHFLGRQYKAHRVVWALVHGEWPADEIDHINGNPGDNRISNLRVVTRAQNMKNIRRLAKNTSGVVGVSWDNINSNWRASIKVNGRCINLGRYKSFEAACAARADAERLHDFHPNHGRAA